MRSLIRWEQEPCPYGEAGDYIGWMGREPVACICDRGHGTFTVGAYDLFGDRQLFLTSTTLLAVKQLIGREYRKGMAGA